MRSTLVIVVLLAVAIIVGPVPAMAADAVGPFCFQLSGFTNILLFRFTPVTQSGVSTVDFLITGTDTQNNRAVSGSGYVSGTNFIFQTTTGLGTADSVLNYGSLNTTTGTGPGSCARVNSVGGCAAGTAGTWNLVTCP